MTSQSGETAPAALNLTLVRTLATEIALLPLSRQRTGLCSWLSSGLARRREARALRIGSERLAATSPHLLRDIGLDAGPDLGAMSIPAPAPPPLAGRT